MTKSKMFAFTPDQGKSLADFDPNENGGLDKEAGKAMLQQLGQQLDDLQDYLYAARQHSVLVILQGMDTSGKDGTIRDVLGFIDPLGCLVQSFKAPTEIERDRDFLWRVHQVVPPVGMVTVFNRSHYEDVLVARVKKLVPEAVWEKRYSHINHFEQLLADNRTLVLKFFLHISKDEQQARLQARADNPDKAWKLAPSDWEDRKLWDAYQQAYWDAISRCHSEQAPWYIISADRKWFRNLAIAQVLLHHLEPYREGWKHSLEERGREGLQVLKKLT